MDYIIRLMSLLIFFVSCEPLSETCPGGLAKVETDIIKVIPLQTSYNKGDEITIKVSVSNLNNFGGTVNLLLATNNQSASLSFGNYYTFFSENLITIIKGTPTPYPGTFLMNYKTDTDSYELELKLKLNRVGNYSFFAVGQSITFQGSDKCNYYIINTNFEGRNSDGKIEFVVQ